MTMRLGFGEGTGVVVDSGRVYLQYDHQEEGAVLALDAADGKELWRAPRRENSSWSTPLVVTHQVRKQLVVTADTKVKAYDGPLPEGRRGIEFTTDLLPDAGGAPGLPTWSGDRTGPDADP